MAISPQLPRQRLRSIKKRKKTKSCITLSVLVICAPRCNLAATLSRIEDANCLERFLPGIFFSSVFLMYLSQLIGFRHERIFGYCAALPRSGG
jgi:hypothetical protein